MKSNNASIKRNTFKLELIKNAELIGRYNFPRINYTKEIEENALFVPFNFALTLNNPQKYYVYFYIDDYQFERLWNQPSKYLTILKKFKGVIAPDFSLYIDMPKAMQIWNVYRSRVLAYYWSINGINVVPNATWSDEWSYSWCFEGLPKNAIIAVSSIGCVKNNKALLNFCKGFSEMEKQLNPTNILFFGKIPESLKNKSKIKHIKEEF